MSPLELELYNQIRNVIGVPPNFYEFLFMIDADTEVAPDACSRMVASFIHDTSVIALCGETGLTNSKHSIITMVRLAGRKFLIDRYKCMNTGSLTICRRHLRVYLAQSPVSLVVSRCIVSLWKKLASLLSSIPPSSTTIPRTESITSIPRICYSSAKIVISRRTVPHLSHAHRRLLLKHHPRLKTKYIRDAKAWTTAPEQWGVFLSQRRRWINSTVHNFLVLFGVPGLCGFCCFSMRFIVMLDLVSTILQPVVVIYLGYIVYLLASHSDIVPITSLLLLAAIYGLQAVIFILRRKWEMVGYLIIYILAIPVYSFALPLHAFWNMDKFSWYSNVVTFSDLQGVDSYSSRGRRKDGDYL